MIRYVSSKRLALRNKCLFRARLELEIDNGRVFGLEDSRWIACSVVQSYFDFGIRIFPARIDAVTVSANSTPACLGLSLSHKTCNRCAMSK